MNRLLVNLYTILELEGTAVIVFFFFLFIEDEEGSRLRKIYLKNSIYKISYLAFEPLSVVINMELISSSIHLINKTGYCSLVTLSQQE